MEGYMELPEMINTTVRPGEDLGPHLAPEVPER